MVYARIIGAVAILASAPSPGRSAGDGIKRRSSLLIRGLIEIPRIPRLLPWLRAAGESMHENVRGYWRKMELLIFNLHRHRGGGKEGTKSLPLFSFRLWHNGFYLLTRYIFGIARFLRTSLYKCKLLNVEYLQNYNLIL